MNTLNITNMCLYPRLIKNKKYEPNKKNGGVIPAISDNRVLAVPVGCGQCIECRRKKTREWKVRLLEDIKHEKNAVMVTLTFSNQSIKKLYTDKKIEGLKGYDLDNGAAKLAVRHFLERWRKKYKKSLRHWLITELGHEGTENIHLHGIVWTKNKEDIEKIWKYGYVYIGKYVSERTINYITKYVTKVDFEHKYYKPIMLTSAGIGREYTKTLNYELNKYKEGAETRETYITRDGIKLALPIYLRNKRYSEEEREKLWLQKLDKQERYVLGQRIDINKGTEHYEAVVKEARLKNERLGYGTSIKNYSQEKYEEQRRTLLQNQRMANIKDNIPQKSKAELWEQSTMAAKGINPNYNY